MKPPIAPKKPEQFDYLHETVTDSYAWLRNRDDRDTLEYLKKENKFTNKWFADVEPLKETLFTEMKTRLLDVDETCPVKKGDWLYYQRVEAGCEYWLYCRKPASGEGKEEILLTPNMLAAGKKYFKLGLFQVSPDHKILACSIDFDGDEKYTIFFKDIETGKLHSDPIPETSYGGAWTSDSKGFYYTTLDEIDRPSTVWFHQLGTDHVTDRKVFEEKDQTFFVGVGTSRDKKYIFIHLGSQVTSEVSYLTTENKMQLPKIVLPRQYETLYMADHRDGYFYLLTDKNAPNSKLIRFPIGKPEQTEVLLDHNPQIKLDYFLLYQNHLVLGCRENGLPTLHIYDADGKNGHSVEFPEAAYQFEDSNNPDFDSPIFRFSYDSLVTPMTIFEYNMVTKERKNLKEQIVPGYDKTKFVTERIFVESHDGTKVPMSIARRSDLEMNGNNPFFLYGYGSYGINNDVSFSVTLPSLLERGFVYAIAHIRGGGEMGRAWYEAGKKEKKMNSFLDFIACGEHVIKAGYTNKEKLVIHGRSAGGLLMGAVVNLRPDLFHAAIPGVPFVDALNTMMDPTLPLTVIEYDEWGDPRQKKYYDCIKAYSPYDNVKAVEYPHLLFQGGLNDPRVGYWEPAKMVAKLREVKKGDQILLLDTKMGEGHSAGAARYERLKDDALRYTFFLKTLGMNE